SFTCESPRATVLVIPAMGVAAKFYDKLGAELAAAGLAAFVMDLRGIGSSNLRASRKVDFGYRELVELDLVAAASAVKTSAKSLRLFVLGHSLGGHLAIIFSALHGEMIAGAIVVAGGTPYFRNWKLPMSAVTLFGSSVMRGLGIAMGYVPGNRLGFAGREANRVVAEWARFVRTGRLTVGGIDHEILAHALEATKLPLLGISFEEDDYAPRIAVDRLLAMLPNAKLTRIHFERGEVGENVDHFRWAKQPTVVSNRLSKWIDVL
ncbi:MAG: alpha/beta fold hydrolase, partial [Polyangiaceae bacterium]